MHVSESNSVTDFDTCHGRPNFSYNANSLMTQCDILMLDMEIGSTYSRMCDSNYCLTPTEFAARLGLHDFAAFGAFVDGEFDCHCGELKCSRRLRDGEDCETWV